MAYAHTLPSATPANFRQAVAQHPLVGDWMPGHTTGAGTTTTVVDSGLSGWGDNEFQEWYALAGADAGSPGQYRTVDSFTASTLTLRTAMTNAVGNDNDYYLHRFRPDWYTLAGNVARRSLYPLIYRQVTGFIVPRTSTVYGLPRNMRAVGRVFSVSAAGLLVKGDKFDRAASTTEPGPGWIETAGNWGVIGERLYSQTDADADLVTLDVEIKDGVIEYTLTGTTNHDTVYRTPALLFRIMEDYLGAIDTANCLVVRLLGTGALAYVDLRKRDGGTETSLATGTQVTVNGTYYTTRVMFSGTRIRVFVDDIELINYELLGADTKYLEGQRTGIRLDKAGSPGTDARVDNIYAYAMRDYGDVTDWRQQGTALTFTHTPSPVHLLAVEGGAVLSALPAATDSSAGAGALTSDTTAVWEILTTDPVWELLVTQGAAELHRIAGSFARSGTDRDYHEQQASRADALLFGLRETHRQPARFVARSP